MQSLLEQSRRRGHVLNLVEQLHTLLFGRLISGGHCVAAGVLELCLSVCVCDGSVLLYVDCCLASSRDADLVEAQPGSPQGPGFTGTINNHK